MLRRWQRASVAIRPLRNTVLERYKLIIQQRLPHSTAGSKPFAVRYPTINMLAHIQVYAFAFYVLGHIEYGYFYEYQPTYGVSMLPTINSFGDFVLVSKYYRRGRGIQMGDIISFDHPVDMDVHAVKRVLGMPGDFVCRDTPGTTGKMIQIPEGHCWVVGDNLPHSRDSRMFGPLPLALIRGKVIRRFEPWYYPHRLDNGLTRAPEDEID